MHKKFNEYYYTTNLAIYICIVIGSMDVFYHFCTRLNTHYCEVHKDTWLCVIPRMASIFLMAGKDIIAC